MSDPKRIQYKRGHKLPEGAKLCARGSKFGNPFKIGALYARPDDWHSITIRKVLGYRIGFMTFERYRAEVSLLAKCPHGPEPEDTDG